jgi:hypothetical protein
LEDRTRDIISKFNQARGKCATWFKNVSEDISFITPGGQWTQEEVNVLKERGQAPIEVPLIAPQIEFQKAQILGRQPSYNVLPRTDTDMKKAKLFGELFKYIWYASDADAVTDEVVNNQLVGGKGYFYIFWDQAQR